MTTAVLFTRQAGMHHALWSFEPSITINVAAAPAGPELASTVDAACETRDVSTLSLLLPQLVEAGFPLEAAQVARVLLAFNHPHAPAISTAHLHNLAVGSYLHHPIPTIGDVTKIA